MKETTRYQYEKRIKELESLSDYRRKMMDIYFAITEGEDTGNGISRKWLLRQFKDLFK